MREALRRLWVPAPPQRGDRTRAGTFLSAPALHANSRFRAARTMEVVMLGWALTFAILSLVAGVLGFFALAGFAASVAKILFLVFLVLLVASFVMRAIRGQSVV
jgi:uncharacterized membrane protein YtjA (UPF0391 family)